MIDGKGGEVGRWTPSLRICVFTSVPTGRHKKQRSKFKGERSRDSKIDEQFEQQRRRIKGKHHLTD